MITTTTTQHLGHLAGRARHVVPAAGWRPAAGFRGLGTTGVDVTPYPVSAHETPGNATDTTEPAIALVSACMTVERPARHLGSRTT